MTRPHKADPGIARRPTIWRDEARVQKSFGSIGDKANVSPMFNKGNIVRFPQHGISFKERRIP
jgi:hypothetical protein